MGAAAVLPIIAIGSTVAGTAISARGQITAGNEARVIGEVNARAIEEIGELNAQLIEEGAEANAGVLEYNARMLEAMARDSIRRGVDDENRFRVDLRGLIGAQRTSYAAQGVEVNSGTALDVQADTAYQGELDALQIRVNAAREAWGFRVEAENTRMQVGALRKNAGLQATSTRATSRADALSSRLGGNAAASAGRYGAAGTILSGATSTAMSIDALRRRN
jgi:hypothetical protein